MPLTDARERSSMNFAVAIQSKPKSNCLSLHFFFCNPDSASKTNILLVSVGSHYYYAYFQLKEKRPVVKRVNGD